MGKAEENKSAQGTVQSSGKNSPLPRIGRMIVCVLTMGMAFPNAFSESVDIADYDARNNQAVKK